MDLRWNLDALYTSFDSPEFKDDFKNFKIRIKEINDWAKSNFNSSENTAGKMEWYINAFNDFSRFTRLYSFAYLSVTVNSQDETAAKYVDLYTSEMTNMAKADVLFKKFVGETDNLDSLIESSQILKQHNFILKEIKQKHSHMLAEDVEVALSKMQTTGSSAWNNMKEQLVSSMSIEVEMNGEKKCLPYPAVRNLAYDSNPKIRKNAYTAELDGYKTVEKGVAAALNAIKGEAITLSKMRGYDSVLHMTLENSRMQKKTLDALLGAIEDYLPSLRRFYKKKAEILGHTNGLPFYDLMAPVGEIDMTFTYEEAADYVIKQFSSFSEKLGNFAKNAFENNWIDAEPRSGKRGGAFCSSNHSLKQSRILANFDGSFSNMTTLAHELGHGYHNACINWNTALNGVYTMPIAETASTFCETIVCNAALKNATKEEKLVILENKISGDLQVIVDIYSRFVFESNIIKERENGPLSVNEFNNIMSDAQKTAYGDGLNPEYLHPYMWLGKVHYYYVSRNFYNFPYAYGLMFAKGLYSKYLSEGESFIPKYDELLAATTTNTLEDIGKLAGIDVTDKAFWVSSLQLLAEDIDEFCTL